MKIKKPILYLKNLILFTFFGKEKSLCNCINYWIWCFFEIFILLDIFQNLSFNWKSFVTGFLFRIWFKGGRDSSLFSNLSGKVQNHLIEVAVMYFSEFAEVNSHEHTCFPEKDVSGRIVGDGAFLVRLVGLLLLEWNPTLFTRGKKAWKPLVY